MPDKIGALPKLDALDLAPAFRIEKRKLNALGILRIEREVDSGAVPGRPEWRRPAAPDRARGYESAGGCFHAATLTDLRGNGFDRLDEMTAVGAPAAVSLALHGEVGDPEMAGAVGKVDLLHDVVAHNYEVTEDHGRRPVHRPVGKPHAFQELVRRAKRLLDLRRDQRKGARRVIAPEGVDLAVDDGADGGQVGRVHGAERRTCERQQKGKKSASLHLVLALQRSEDAASLREHFLRVLGARIIERAVVELQARLERARAVHVFLKNAGADFDD